MFLYRFYFLFFLFISINLLGQISEIGISVGGVSPISDVGKEIFIVPSSYSFGLYYKKHIGKRYIFRVDGYYHNLYGDDKQSVYQVKRERGYSFDERLLELSVGMDITFWEYDHFKNNNHILYFIGEVSFINITYKNPEILPKEVIYNNKNLITFGVPLGIGYKRKYGYWVFSLEYKYTFVFSNNLEGRNIKNYDNYNVNTYDGYDFYNYFIFSIGYSFEREPCKICK